MSYSRVAWRLHRMEFHTRMLRAQVYPSEGVGHDLGVDVIRNLLDDAYRYALDQIRIQLRE